MVSDAILGRPNPWADLFDPGRAAIRRGVWEYIKENTDYPYYLIRDRFAGVEGRSLRAVKRGQGKVIAARWDEGCGLSRRQRIDDPAVRDVHAHGLHRGLE